jgi:hypothetical protein
MKRKVIAFLLIAIMTLTVFSAIAVTTTQKVEAAKPTSSDLVIAYKPGAKYVFKVNQFNWHRTPWYYGIDAQGSKPFHQEVAAGSVALSAISASPTQKVVVSYADTGIRVQMNGDWDTLCSKPCKVTMHMSYNLATKGPTEAKVRAIAGRIPAWEKDAWPRGPLVLKGTETVTYPSSVSAFFSPNEQGTLESYIFAETVAVPYSSSVSAVGYASSLACLDYVTIEFPQATG